MDKNEGRKTDLYIKKQIKMHIDSVENSRKDLGHDLHDSNKCSFCTGNGLNLNFQRDPERMHDSYGPCNVKGKKL